MFVFGLLFIIKICYNVSDELRALSAPDIMSASGNYKKTKREDDYSDFTWQGDKGFCRKL
jgi:hypothetical protein